MIDPDDGTTDQKSIDAKITGNQVGATSLNTRGGMGKHMPLRRYHRQHGDERREELFKRHTSHLSVIDGSWGQEFDFSPPNHDLMNADNSVPEFLCHYYEASRGPFLNLSDLPLDEAERLLSRIRAVGDVFASRRAADYLLIRRGLEQRVRELFIARGGKPQRECPHYMILGACPWVKSWYREGRELVVPLAKFDSSTVSFTYGDTFPTMRYQDGKPYRGRVFLLGELAELVREFGLPQVQNPGGRLGPDRYIEAQVWADEPLASYLQQNTGCPAEPRHLFTSRRNAPWRARHRK